MKLIRVALWPWKMFAVMLAVLVGVVGTLVAAAFTVMVVAVWVNRLGRRADWTCKVPYWWGRTVELICNKVLLLQKSVSFGDHVSIADDEAAIALVVHPTYTAIAQTNKTVTDVCMWLKVIMKVELADTLFGKVMDALNIAIFVDRGNGDSARASLDQGLSQVKPPLAVFICPDYTRPTPEKINAAIERMEGKIRGLGEWLRYTVTPKAGAFKKALAAMASIQIKPKIILTWTVYTHEEWGRFTSELVRATYHTHTFDLTEAFYERFPGNQYANVPEVLLQDWLNEIWRDLVNAGIHLCKTGGCQVNHD